MLRMDGFTVSVARTPEEAVGLYTAESAYLAGGTDLLPNLKHRIVDARHLIAIAGAIPCGWQVEGESVVIGAGTRLSRLAQLDRVPPLAQAAGLVAGPQVRNMGTLGGNVLLDTRCLYYNQSEPWRRALGWCLKAQGDWCHVTSGPKTCVAARSSDTVPVLLAMGATLRMLGPTGPRELSIRDLYRFDGKDHLAIAPGELLTHIEVPLPGPGFRGSYAKLRTRDAIDFPQLGIAIAGSFEGTGPSAVARTLEIVIGAANPQPKPVRKLDAFLGIPLADNQIGELAEVVFKQTRPQGSVAGDAGWRRQMARVFVARDLRTLRDQGS